MKNILVVLKIAFLPSCAVGPVLSAFSDATDQPKMRRAKTRKTNFFRRLQVVMMPGLERGAAGERALVYSAGRVQTPHPRWWQDGDLCQRRARPAHRRKLVSSRRRAGLSSSAAKLSKTFVLFTADVRGGQRGEATILKVRPVLLCAEGLLMSQRWSRKNGRMVEERRSPWPSPLSATAKVHHVRLTLRWVLKPERFSSLSHLHTRHGSRAGRPAGSRNALCNDFAVKVT